MTTKVQLAARVPNLNLAESGSAKARTTPDPLVTDLAFWPPALYQPENVKRVSEILA